jgi:hypothetical protein
MRKVVVRAQLKGPFPRGGILAIRPILEADLFGIIQKFFSPRLLEQLIHSTVISLDIIGCLR